MSEDYSSWKTYNPSDVVVISLEQGGPAIGYLVRPKPTATGGIVKMNPRAAAGARAWFENDPMTKPRHETYDDPDSPDGVRCDACEWNALRSKIQIRRSREEKKP